MKKGFCLVLVLLAVALYTISPIFADDAVTLKVYNYLDMSSPMADSELNQIWGAFEKANPNIKLEIEHQFNEPFHQKLQGYIAAGQLPDVVYMWPGGRSTTLHKQHLVKDLKPFLGSDIKNFSPAAVAPQAGGYLAEIPICVTSCHVMFTNQKMLSDMKMSYPKTYAQLKAMAKKLKAAGKSTVLIGSKDAWVIQCVLFSMIQGRLNGDAYTDKLIAGEAKFTDAPFVKALKFYEQLYKDGVLSANNMQIGYNDVNGLWASGKAPFMVDGDWKVSNFLTDPSTKSALIPVSEQKNYSLNVFPAIPGEKFHNTTATVAGTGFGMSSKIAAGSAKEKAAWKLISWLISPEVERIRLEIGQAFPSRKGVTTDKLEPLAVTRAGFYGAYSGSYVLDSVLDASVVTPLNVGLQEIGMGTATPEQVAQNIQKAYDVWKANQK